MASGYEIKVKAPALDAVKTTRDRVRARLGSTKIGDRLQGLDAASASALANELLALLDAVDQVIGRAKPID